MPILGPKLRQCICLPPSPMSKTRQGTSRQATTKQLETRLNDLKYAIDEGSKELETEVKKVSNVNERIDTQLESLRNRLDQAETVASGLSKLKGDIKEGFASLRSGISSHQEQVDSSMQEWQRNFEQITNKKLQSIEVTLTSILSALPTPESNNSQIPDSRCPPCCPPLDLPLGHNMKPLNQWCRWPPCCPPCRPPLNLPLSHNTKPLNQWCRWPPHLNLRIRERVFTTPVTMNLSETNLEHYLS
ncbi:hypothetical protein EDB89DRAFT_1570966 [Lactarius sanguifluus]|nr:hypothetical protein EDB89DRAFT_1570966 [Lactarius sanguifluus]